MSGEKYASSMSGSHGHVNRRLDGALNRCGGPAICGQCAVEECLHCGFVGLDAVQRHDLRDELIAIGAISERKLNAAD